MLRACVIGMGPIGNNHATVYSSLPNVRLAAVCDRQADRAEAGGKKYNAAYYLDAQKMLDAEKPDIVSVATGGFEYSSDHYEPTIQALEAGAHVLTEKPISNDIGLGQKMVDKMCIRDRYTGETPGAVRKDKRQTAEPEA